MYLVQLMRTTNFTKHKFQCHQSKVSQSVSIFWMKLVFWYFLVYFDLNLKLLDFEINQKVNKQIRIGCSYKLN
jgi:hypothetical protein